MIEDINFGKEIALGIFIGLLFVVLNSVFGLVIGIPLLSFSSETERYVVQDAVAPLAEELVFRAFLPFALAVIGIPFVVNLFINAIAFLGYHFAAYGSSIAAASSLFIGAGLFAIVAFLATYYQSDVEDFQVPIAAIIGHVIINTWLGIKASAFVVIGSAI